MPVKTAPPRYLLPPGGLEKAACRLARPTGVLLRVLCQGFDQFTAPVTPPPPLC